jgi:hypothetical protein
MEELEKLRQLHERGFGSVLFVHCSISDHLCRFMSNSEYEHRRIQIIDKLTNTTFTPNAATPSSANLPNEPSANTPTEYPLSRAIDTMDLEPGTNTPLTTNALMPSDNREDKGDLLLDAALDPEEELFLPPTYICICKVNIFITQVL